MNSDGDKTRKWYTQECVQNVLSNMKAYNGLWNTCKYVSKVVL